MGGSLHALNFEAPADTYFRKADDEILVVIQTEHILAVDIADAIYSVPGIDAVFVGPNDLAATMRSSDGTPPDAATFEATLARINEACHRNNVPSGLHVQTAEQALQRAKEGWQFIAVASELKFMLDGVAALAAAVHPELAKADLARY